jgi:hypothetical protein
MKKFFLTLMLIVGVLIIIASIGLLNDDAGGFVFMLLVGLVFLYFSVRGLWPQGSSGKGNAIEPSGAVEQAKARELAAAIKQQGNPIAVMEGITEDKRRETAAYAVKLVVDDFLEDDILSEEEEAILSEFINKTSYSINELDDYNGVRNILKASTLRKVLNGEKPENTPDFQMPVHFNFQKSETLIWAFSNVAYYQEITRRHYEGGHQGFSVRVAKGLYYRTGAFKGRPVEEKSMEYVDTGILVLTTKHIYFGSYNKMFRVRYNKIVAFTPYDDGLGIMKDSQRAKPMVFKLEDGWLAYNLAINLARQLEG